MKTRRIPDAALARWSAELVDAATIEKIIGGRILDLDVIAMAEREAKGHALTMHEHMQLLAARDPRVKRHKVKPPESPPWSEAGPRLWAEIYARAIAFSGDIDAENRFMDSVLSRLPKKSCPCETNFFKFRQATPPDFTSADTLFAWWSRHQNNVNAENGKDRVPLSRARVQWGLDSPSKPAGDYFACIPVISLKRTPERLAKFRSAWPVDWPFAQPDLFEAIDGEKITPRDGYRGGNGAWGLLRTLVAILDRYIAMRPSKPLMIFEDDCEWNAGSMPKLLDFIGRLPADYDCAFPGAQHRGGTIPAGKGILRALGAHRMHCIIISPQFAPKLRELWDHYDYINDHLLTDISSRQKFYASDQYLCFQQANVSNLLGHYVGDRGGEDWSGSMGVSRPDPDDIRYHKTYPLKCGGTKRFINVGGTAGIQRGVDSNAARPTVCVSRK